MINLLYILVIVFCYICNINIMAMLHTSDFTHYLYYSLVNQEFKSVIGVERMYSNSPCSKQTIDLLIQIETHFMATQHISCRTWVDLCPASHVIVFFSKRLNSRCAFMFLHWVCKMQDCDHIVCHYNKIHYCVEV